MLMLMSMIASAFKADTDANMQCSMMRGCMERWAVMAATVDMAMEDDKMCRCVANMSVVVTI